MEITFREIILSIAIVSFMLIIGLMLSGVISDSIYDSNQIYNTAVHIDNEELFRYGMSTNVGNALVYGELAAIDTVSYPEIEGEYLYVKKIREEYRKHTRTESYSCGKSTCYREVVYYSWDEVKTEHIKSTKATFLGVEFDLDKFNTPSSHYLTTIKKRSDLRFKYYVVPAKVTGTIFTELKDDDIGSKSYLYENMDADQTLEYLNNEGKFILFIFWVSWSGLTGFAMYKFYYLENRWLY